MNLSQKRAFQIHYLERKLALESSETDYITDRSFLDVAAYWIEYNQMNHESRHWFIEKCRKNAARYDAHFYFPVGLLPLEADGFRTVDAAWARISWGHGKRRDFNRLAG